MLTFSEIREREIRNDILFEFKYGFKINDAKLNEEHGRITFIERYVNIIGDYVKQNVIQKQLYDFTINNNIFSDIGNCFFNYVELNIQFNYDIKNGGYGNIDTTVPLADNGNLMCLKGGFVIKGKPYDAKNIIMQIFSHEILHAYEDWCRRKKGKNGITYDIENSGYDKVVDGMLSSDEIEKQMSNIMYFLTNFEERAYIHSLDSYLKSKKIVNSFKSVVEILKESPIYKNYVSIGENIDSLFQQIPEKGNDIVAFYQRITNKKDDNPEKILNVLMARWRKLWKKFRITASKMVYDIFCENTKGNTFCLYFD